MSQDKENEFHVQIARRKAPNGRRVRVKRPQSFLDSLAPRRGGGSRCYRNSSGRAVQRSFHRRVIVKASIKKMAGAGAAKLNDHLFYLERDATQKDASPGKLYGSLIQQMADLKAYTRELISIGSLSIITIPRSRIRIYWCAGCLMTGRIW